MLECSGEYEQFLKKKEDDKIKNYSTNLGKYEVENGILGIERDVICLLVNKIGYCKENVIQNF